MVIAERTGRAHKTQCLPRKSGSQSLKKGFRDRREGKEMQGTDADDLGCHSLRGPSEDGVTWLGQAGPLQVVLLLAQ